jgi:hypothetical protein
MLNTTLVMLTAFTIFGLVLKYLMPWGLGL